MLSDVEIYNLALGHIGVDKDIASLDESSKEARLAKKWLEISRDFVIRDYNWPFARKFVTLSLVEENPTYEWAYSYRYPSDCAFFRRIIAGVQANTLFFETDYSFQNYAATLKIPFIEGQDSQGKLIYTSMEEAQGEYTAILTNGLFRPPDFDIAWSYRLAAFLAPSLTSGDPFKLGDKAMQMYQIEIEKAAANAANEEQNLITNESGFTRSRL